MSDGLQGETYSEGRLETKRQQMDAFRLNPCQNIAPLDSFPKDSYRKLHSAIIRERDG